jgi:flagellar hook-associated protein 3 FlgL
MRISTSMSYQSSIDNLQERQQNLSASQAQLTSGKRVVHASDDPTNAARAERALASIARADANQRTLDASRNVMNLASSSLSNATELLQTARETLIAAGNSSYSDADRTSLAVKLKDVRDQLLAVANRPDGGGGYVFGGQGSSSPPFVDTTNGVIFQGQTGESLASTGERLSLTLDGQKVWLNGKSGNGVFNTGPASNASTGTANSGNAWITAGSVTNPSQLPYPSNVATPPTYSVLFHNTGGSVTYDILEDGNALATGQSFASGKSIAIPGRGMSVAIEGSPADGDTFNLTQSQNNLNIFTSLDSVIASLKTPLASAATIAQAVNTGMTNMDAAMGSVQGAQSEVGEQLNRMDGIESRNADQKLAAQTAKSNAEDLDMVEALSEFKNQESGYQAALQSYAMVQKLSLFNYISS